MCEQWTVSLRAHISCVGVEEERDNQIKVDDGLERRRATGKGVNCRRDYVEVHCAYGLLDTTPQGGRWERGGSVPTGRRN